MNTEKTEAVCNANAALSAAGLPTYTERDMKTQWWLAELDMHGNPKLTDGAHSVRAGAEEALTLMQRLGLAKDRHFAIAEVRLTEPTGKHGQVNEEAIATLNAIGLRPNAPSSPAAKQSGGMNG